MTSKNSYFDLSLIRDKLLKNAWIITLYSVVLFFARPVFMAIKIQSYINSTMNSKEQFMTGLVSNFFTINGEFITFLAIPAAVIAAATVFFYLNSKKQVDFYHSLPIKREKLFVTSYLTGVIFYLIPYTASFVLSLIVVTSMGFISYLTPTAVISGFLLNLLFYIVIYTISILAMILCGNLIVGLMGTVVFLGIGPLLCTAYIEIMKYFYINYYSELYRIDNFIRNSSPVFDFMWTNGQYTFSAARVVTYIILTVILFSASLYLYMKRPSEAAGHAIAFKISRPIIKYPIVFISTLISGLFFMSVGGRSMGWMIFGFVCGGVISHFFIEIIFHFEFKAIFKNLKGLSAFAVLFAIFISVPAFDLTNYDSRLPQKEDIKNVSIRIMDFNQNLYFKNFEGVMPADVINHERAILDNLTFSEQNIIDAVYEIAKMGIYNTKAAANENIRSVGVEFELLNGKKITRRYASLKSSEIEPYIISVFDTEEFKQKFYNIYSATSSEATLITIQDLYARNGMDSTAEITSAGKIIPLIDALRSDMLKLNGQDMKTETPVMVLRVINGDPKIKVIWEMQFPVYPSFAQTMGILNSLGIKKPSMIPVEMVDYIEINNYEYEKYMASSYAKDRTVEYTDWSKDSGVRITDKGEIANIFKCIVPEIVSNLNPFFASERGYRVRVVSSRYLNGYGESFVFMKASMPEFIKAKFPVPDSAK